MGDKVKELTLRIQELKKRQNAVVLAHNYQVPEVYQVADIRGDSLALAREAAKTDADVIVVCGVVFMAETAKILNPSRLVLIPDPTAGCPLADSISPEDVRKLKQLYPDAPVVAYVNTTAAVKAEADVCCTSANAVEVVNAIDANRVIFVPDANLAAWVAANTDKEIIPWQGHCPVHDQQLKLDEIRRIRRTDPEAIVIAHPECPMEILKEANAVGSTSQMVSKVSSSSLPSVFLVTERSMTENLAPAFPGTKFHMPKEAICEDMKKITLEKLVRTLEELVYPIELDAGTIEAARKSVEAMVRLGV